MRAAGEVKEFGKWVMKKLANVSEIFRGGQKKKNLTTDSPDNTDQEEPKTKRLQIAADQEPGDELPGAAAE